MLVQESGTGRGDRVDTKPTRTTHASGNRCRWARSCRLQASVIPLGRRTYPLAGLTDANKTAVVGTEEMVDWTCQLVGKGRRRQQRARLPSLTCSGSRSKPRARPYYVVMVGETPKCSRHLLHGGRISPQNAIRYSRLRKPMRHCRRSMWLRNAWYIGAWADELGGKPLARRISATARARWRRFADRCCRGLRLCISSPASRAAITVSFSTPTAAA